MRALGVVRAHRAALLDTAFLLDGDEHVAEERADRALARLPRGADRAAAVRALLRTRPPRTALAGDGDDPWWVGPDELAAARRTAGTLAGLDPAARTALVLDHAGLPADPAALTRARARFADPAAALAGLLAVRRPPRRDDAAAAGAVAAHRRARRTRPLVALAALAALAVLVPVALRAPDPAPAPTGRFEGPTRGSLAGDTGFLADVRGAPWSGAPGPAVTDRRVVFAGDLLDRRWVLVAGPVDGRTTGQWSTGPAGAAAGDLVPADGPVALAEDRPAALLLDTALVVVAAPDEVVRVSTGQVVTASGGVQREFADLPLDDGAGARQLAAPDPGGFAVRVRVGDPAGSADVPVAHAGSADAAADGPAATPLRGTDPDLGARQDALDGALAAATVPTGQDPAGVVPTVLWAGALPHPLGGAVDAVVLVVPQPSGALVLSTAWADRLESGARQQIGCGSRAFPAGTDPADLVVAARCVVADRNTGTARATVVLTTPGGTTLVPDDDRTRDVLDAGAGGPVPVTDPGPGDLFAE